MITRNHRRLKGFTFKTFHLASLISCGLLCQRDPRCVSTNFRKVFKSEGTCKLNDRGVLLTEKGNGLEYNEEAIYTQFLRHEGNQKSLDKRRRRRCYWFHDTFVFHSWYLSHKIFIFRQMWKISISHIFLWMFLSFGLQLAHLCSLHTLLGYFTYRSNLLSVLVRSTNCCAMFNFLTVYILWLKITTLLT